MCGVCMHQSDPTPATSTNYLPLDTRGTMTFAVTSFHSAGRRGTQYTIQQDKTTGENSAPADWADVAKPAGSHNHRMAHEQERRT